MLDSSNKSEIAVLKVELAANLKGYHVCLPKNQASRYDLVIDDGYKLWRCQVKFLNRRAGKNCLELKIEDKRYKNKKCYTDKEIDILLVYIPKLEQILCFHPKDFHNKRTIRVNLNNPKAPSFYKKFLW